MKLTRGLVGARTAFIATFGFLALVFSTSSVHAQSCGDPATGDCCEANGSAFCDDQTCCELVCGLDAFCCDVEWDDVCAATANDQCDLCGGGGGGPCEFETCGTGGDCFTVSTDPGCSDADCCCVVCEFNPFCCDVEWDATCVDDANALCGGSGGCGDPNSGGCDVANGTPFCDDLGCCNTICAADPFCCDTAWDQICADAALQLCYGEPCPDGECTGNEDVNENEPCGEDTNGGCNSATPVYTELGSVGVGDSVSVCGNAWADFDTRDTDWYRFTLTDFAEVSWTVNGSGLDNDSPGAPMVAFVITGTCPAAVIEAGGGQCPTTVSACLPAGTYVVFAGLNAFNGFACPGISYTAELTVNDPKAAGCPVPPENDDCAGAIEIFEGDTDFSTIGAFTSQPPLGAACESFGSTQIFNDIWFQWTPTCDTLAQVSTCNQADFDTRLAVYAEVCPELPGEEIACNDDGTGCTGFTSQLQFEAFEGVTYYIRVGSFGATASGTGILSLCGCDIECPELPACGVPGTGSCSEANGTPYCEDAECCELVCAGDPFCCDTAWDQICADTALALCFAEPCEAGQNCPPDAVEEGEPCGSDTNGGCNSGDPGPTTPLSIGDTVCGTFWADDNTRDTDWYEFTVDVDSDVTWAVNADIDVVAFLISASCPPAIIASDDAGTCPTTVEACLPAGTYRAFVALPVFGGIPCGSDSTNYTATLTAVETDQCGLDNDVCAGAIEVETGDTPFSNVGSFTEGDNLPAECESFGSVTMFNDIWFKWVSDQTGDITVSTCNQASFDTRLAAYVGECESLELVACNDDGDGCSGFTSSMPMSVEEGVTYYIRLGSYGAAGQGDGVLSIGEGGGGGTPENDECEGAIEVFDGVTGVNNFNATNSPIQPPEDLCTFFGSATVNNDVWYSYSTTCDGTVTISFCEANGGSASFDTKLAVWSGPDCDSLTIVACNDDTCGLRSEVTFDAVCGEAYYIQFGAYSTAGSGSGQMAISCAGDACDDPTDPGDLNGDGVVNAADLNILLAAWGTDNAIADINGDGIVNAADLNILLAGWTGS